MDVSLLKSFWSKLFPSDIVFIIFAFVGINILRFMGDYYHAIYLVVVGFIIMWIMPVVFLTKSGRRKIGITLPSSWFWTLFSFVIGFIVAFIIYWAGYLLYGTGLENWGMSVVNEYLRQGHEVVTPQIVAIVVIPAMLFSPIGEEFFYRGIIMEVLRDTFSNRKVAEILSSIAFAVAHISHYDLVFSGRPFFEVFMPMLLFVVLMFFLSYVFIFARQKSGSIWGAVIAHAGSMLGLHLAVYFSILSTL